MTFRRVLAVAALGWAVTGSAHAQTSDENRSADALAADMRLLAANPLDIEALITAGELTLKLGDPTAAAGFFTRAEKLDPLNPRIKAGWGSLMVRAERPGEALRRFQEAEARGLDPVKYAADRGLAYDLIGQQERAQRDYRLVLRSGPDDEVTRRYALSLGISGRKEEALKLLDPLLQRSDRAAWRSRAFVLAMNGDTAGAEKIAETMMSPGLGAGLTPFFRRLPQLDAKDRAFAVNFGELVETPARVADARLVPALPALGPDPNASKPMVAVVPKPVVVTAVDPKREKHRTRGGGTITVTRVPLPAPAPPPAELALTPPPYVAPSAAPAPHVAPPVVVAQSKSLPAPAIVTPPPSPPAPVVTQSPRTVVATTAPPHIAPTSTPAPQPAPVENTPPVVVTTTPSAAPEPLQPGVADQPSAAEAGVPATTAVARVSEDSVLARIVANAGAAPAPPPLPTPTPPIRIAKAEPRPTSERAPAKIEPKPPAKTPAKSTHSRAEKNELATIEQPGGAKARRSKDVAASPDDSAAPKKDSRGRPIKVAAADEAPALDKNGCPLPPAPAKGKRRASVPAKVPLSAKCKKLAAAAAEQAKADAEARSNPARVWVQVAGGANEASLEGAWKIMRDRAPALLRGRQGWTTPLRATNRVLTGPFKDEDEAQAFVNKLTKAGVPAFVFTSTKGQKIEKLGSK